MARREGVADAGRDEHDASMTITSRSFDYVVVGSGSAGATLVGRLLADTPASVLLIEAGGTHDREDIRDFTQTWRLFQPGSDVDWAFVSEPQEGCAGRTQSYSTGKVLGGSSSVNGMVWVRGNPADYDRWAAEGCTGWSFADVLPSFKAIEAFPDGDPDLRGTTGPVFTTTALTRGSDLAQAFCAVAGDLGYPLNDDYNGASQHGCSFTQLNATPEGLRQDAYSAFVQPHVGDPRLTVLTGALATRIAFDDQRRAHRVLLEVDGAEVGVDVAREVIVAAGTINAPALLMRSGVGPGDHLQSLGIPVVADVGEVGRNLADHVVSVAARQVRDPDLSGRRAPMEVSIFAGRSRTGPPGTPAFQVQTYYVGKGWRRWPQAMFALGAIHLHPTSRGTVTLAAPDVHKPPVIDPHLLSTPEDMAAQIDAYQQIRRILAAPGLDRWLVEGERIPAVDDDRLAEAVREYSEADFHPVGTCRMGADASSVVDPRLRVRGVQGLRVVGAAAIPYLPSGNTNAPAMMTGDRLGRFMAAGD
jgi:choline dehydrogenase